MSFICISWAFLDCLGLDLQQTITQLWHYKCMLRTVPMMGLRTSYNWISSSMDLVSPFMARVFPEYGVQPWLVWKRWPAKSKPVCSALAMNLTCRHVLDRVPEPHCPCKYCIWLHRLVCDGEFSGPTLCKISTSEKDRFWSDKIYTLHAWTRSTIFPDKSVWPLEVRVQFQLLWTSLLVYKRPCPGSEVSGKMSHVWKGVSVSRLDTCSVESEIAFSLAQAFGVSTQRK